MELSRKNLPSFFPDVWVVVMLNDEHWLGEGDEFNFEHIELNMAIVHTSE